MNKINGKYDVSCSFKANKDSKESKKVTLRFILEEVELEDIITSALASKRIVWQNGPGRGKFDLWKDGQVIEVNYKAPGVNTKSEEERIMELSLNFQKAGLKKQQALELATKAIKNPEILG